MGQSECEWCPNSCDQIKAVACNKCDQGQRESHPKLALVHLAAGESHHVEVPAAVLLHDLHDPHLQLGRQHLKLLRESPRRLHHLPEERQPHEVLRRRGQAVPGLLVPPVELEDPQERVLPQPGQVEAVGVELLRARGVEWPGERILGSR